MSAITVKRKEVKFMVIAVNWQEKKDNSGKYCQLRGEYLKIKNCPTNLL